MANKIFFLITSMAILLLTACAGSTRQYSCSWTPATGGAQDAAFCVDYSVIMQKRGSSLFVLDDPGIKSVKQIQGKDLFIDPSNVAEVRKKALSRKRRSCSHFWVSANVSVQPDTGDYWSPHWGVDKQITRGEFPFYKVLVHQLYDARCIKNN